MLIQSVFGHNDEYLINPASVDIRIGKTMMVERNKGTYIQGFRTRTEWVEIDLTHTNEQNPTLLKPGQFVLMCGSFDLYITRLLYQDWIICVTRVQV